MLGIICSHFTAAYSTNSAIFTEMQVIKIRDFETGPDADSRGPFSKFTKDKIKRDSDFKPGLYADISRLTLIFYRDTPFSVGRFT